MSIGSMIRWLLAWAAALVVVWSFFEVGMRLWREHDPSDHRTRLVIMQWGDASEEQIVEGLKNQYEKEHPDIKIERIHANDFDPKLKTMMAAGTPPDLFYLNSDDLADFATEHLITNLDPLIADMPDGQKWLDGYYPVLLNAFRFDGHAAGSGHLYGIPKDFTTMLMYVNCDLFKQAGIAIPYGGWTWDEFFDDCKKISKLPADAAGRDYGAVFNAWPGMIQCLMRCYGGDLFNGSDFTHITIDTPAGIKALSVIQQARFVDESIYHSTGPQSGSYGEQLFYTGKVAILGPVGRWQTPHFRGVGQNDEGITSFHWDVVPLPHEQKAAVNIATVAWTMSADTKHPKEAMQLLRFLAGARGQEVVARGGMAIPSLRAVAESPAFLSGKPAHSQIFLDEVKDSYNPVFPSDPEFSQYMTDDISECLDLNQESPKQVAQDLSTDWAHEMASPLKTKQYPPMRWMPIVAATGLMIAVAVASVWLVSRRQKLGALDKKMERVGWLFVSPWVIGFIGLTLGPMVLSLLLSMTRWTAMTPMTTAQFVGADNYKEMATYDFQEHIKPALLVTGYYAALSVPLGQLAALAVAMLMNSRARGITMFRTIYYIPTLVGGVTMAAIWLWLLNPTYGLINHILGPIASKMGTAPPDWIGSDADRWAVPAMVMMSMWTVGGGMLTYLAALKNVPFSLYEAARIDGASATRQFFTVTIPMISPLIFFNLIMAIIGSFQVFAQVFVMTGGGPKNATLFYVIYLYRQAFQFHNMGYASALAWVLFLLVLALTGIVIRGSKSWVYYEGLKA